MRFYWKFYTKVFLFVSFIFFYCEYLIYYFVISQCSWPELEIGEKLHNADSMIKSMILADTHLLGPYRGHWFDKLRREWQMYRSFQSAVSIYKPDVVFILGDLFDEGQWCNDDQFQKYINRFSSLFEVPENTQLYVVPGNHDLGFHYSLSPYLLYEFEQTFNISSVKFLNLKGNYFILLNSMAMEGDNCYLCFNAEQKLKRIAANGIWVMQESFTLDNCGEAAFSLICNWMGGCWHIHCLMLTGKMSIIRKLKCMKNENCSSKNNHMKYSRPILLQHFPMYRKSDARCNETDEAPPDLKNTLFKEKWDCLSKDASEMIYNELNPRAIFTGHVHHGCHTIHRGDIHEYTLSSFSWRNKNNPTFILAKITPNEYSIKKCDLPRETTVIVLYSSVLLGIIIRVICKCKNKLKKF